jgi:hypothetical protein
VTIDQALPYDDDDGGDGHDGDQDDGGDAHDM